MNSIENTVAKDKIFCRKHSLNLGGKLHILDRPWVMGILNITPDSFYDGDRYNSIEDIRERIKTMLDEGADIIDIGASSTRPGAKHISAPEEIQRLKPVLELCSREFSEAIISIDTYQSEVARAAVDMGAHMINDISGGTMDAAMHKTMGSLKVPYVLMHIQGTPSNMQEKPQYENVVMEVAQYFTHQLRSLLQAGVNDIILDPGFGFGKTLSHNYELLQKLSFFNTLERPLLVGISRKSMINKLLGIKASEALNGTTVLNTIALQNNVSFLRVHDVRQAVEAAKIVTFTQNLS